MPVELIANTDVDFPFEPYECQRKFMECVIKALDNESNAALESPTGTGKTLSLLCAALGWLEKYKANIRPNIGLMKNTDENGKSENAHIFPQILYASRTHSQLQQVVRELNKTRYKYVKVCTLASRDQLCINDRVKKEENSQIKGQVCRNLVKAHKCIYYNTLDKDTSALDEMYKKECSDVPDIEDLVNVATKFKHCPYFRTQNLLETADLVLLPYNYVFDPKVRQAMKVKLKGNILIIDEAHNLESTCEDSISIEWSSKDTALCIAEAKKVLQLLLDDDELQREQAENSNVMFNELNERDLKRKALDVKQRINQADVAHLLERLMTLEENIDELGTVKSEDMTKISGLEGVVYPGERMIKLLEASEFQRTQRDAVLNVIDLIGMYLAKQASDNVGGFWVERGTKLAEFGGLISRVFADSFEVPDPYTPISKTSANQASLKFLMYVENADKNVKIKYWCFSASTAMKLVASRGLKSIIVASGTLSPLPSFLASLEVPFPFTLENDHIAKKDQVVVGALKYGPNNVNLIGTMKNRTNDSYLNEMGLTLLNTMQVTPQGMLIFFASYTQMNSMIKDLKRLTYAGSDYWTLLGKCKKLFIEPKSKMELPMLLAEFDTTIRNGKGAAFFAVCRGKVSEGIDLPDSHCRAVFICGIPYSPPNDPKIVLKKHFLQMRINKKDKFAISPDEWYKQEALKAINQAIGRVIRHKDDFGIVVLADSRFATVQQSHLSAWLRPCLKVFSETKPFFDICERFFRERNVFIQKSNLKLKMSLKPAEVSSFFKPRGRDKENVSLTVDSLNTLYGNDDDSDIEIIEVQKKTMDTTKTSTVVSSSTQLVKKSRPRIKVASSNYFTQPAKPTPTAFRTTVTSSAGTSSTSSNPFKRLSTATDQRPVKKAVTQSSISGTEFTVAYKKKINELPANIKESVLTSQRKYAVTSQLSDLIPGLRESIPYDPSIFSEFERFVRPEHKDEFALICNNLGV